MIARTAQHCLYTGNARVTEHAWLNPEYPHGSIPNYQDFAIFGDIEEAAIKNETIPDAATMPSSPDAAEAAGRGMDIAMCSTNSPMAFTGWKIGLPIWKLLVILDSMLECPAYAFESIMQWAAEFHQAGYDFAPKAKNQHSNISYQVL